MSRRRQWSGTAVALLAAAFGGATTTAWALAAGAWETLAQARAFAWWLALPAVCLTLANIGLRFVRWQFLLRRAGLRLPARESLAVFIAGPAMLLTPAYSGEGFKAVLAARRSGRGRAALAPVAAVVVAERLFDATALALLGGGALLALGHAGPGAGLVAAGTLAAGGLAAAPGALLRLAGRVWPQWAAPDLDETLEEAGAPHLSWRVAPLALGLSLAAWLLGCLTLWPVAHGAGLLLGPLDAVASYASATLLGGVTLLPAGVGVVGTAIVLRLEALGVTPQQAVVTAVVVRLVTTWLTVGIGAAGSLTAGFRWRTMALGSSDQAAFASVQGKHFETLSGDYAGQLAPHTRERVVGRKAAVTVARLAAHGVPPGARVLDAGCGHGWMAAELSGAGFRMTAMDLAVGQVAAARRWLRETGQLRDTGLAAGSLLALPFEDGAFDAAYCVNVLHHVGARAAQRAALRELARVVRPGGVVLVHEINTRNPLYRLYMAYVFPLLKRIDLGTEHWLRGDRLPAAPGLRLEGVEFYTFLPDFAPAGLTRRMQGMEARLERTRFASFSAHFTAIYAREPVAAPADRDLTPVETTTAGRAREVAWA
jgi:SAM-dependent methyltransferase/uncharacterized membrane protein YbhN (UPF0104 family)